MRYRKGYRRLSSIWDENYNYAAFSVVSRPTQCCGLYAVQNIVMGLNGRENMLYLLDKHVKNRPGERLGFIATHVSPSILGVFKEFGFEVIKEFYNPNTSKTVQLLYYRNEGENA